MEKMLGLAAVLLTGAAFLFLGFAAGQGIFQVPTPVVAAAGTAFIAAIIIALPQDEDRGHRPPLLTFVAGMAIIRRALAFIRVDVPSKRSHRAFASGIGGHVAQMAAGLAKVLDLSTAGSPPLQVARSAAA